MVAKTSSQPTSLVLVDDLSERPQHWRRSVEAVTHETLAEILESLNSGGASTYRPYLRTRDVKSLGFRGRIFSSTTHRITHLMSSIEQWSFMLFDLAPAVREIREQQALLPAAETQLIAQQLGIRHPKWQGQPIVMTTDLFVTALVDGVPSFHAFSIKPFNRSEQPRVLQKFAIEREYWQRRGIQCHMLTDQHLPKRLVQIIEWLHPFVDRQSLWPMSEAEITKTERTLLALAGEGWVRLATLCQECDHWLGFPQGRSRSLAVVRHLLASGHWSAKFSDLDVRQSIRLQPGTNSSQVAVISKPNSSQPLTGADHG